jgi:ParB-like chromosome segregation protein Spo0J
MKIEQLKLTELIPYANNAKLHDDAQVASIAGSIKQFGFNNPVLIDKDGGIIAGHGRVLAARKLELDKVPCIRLGHLTENQKRAYIIADNRLAETGGGWDRDMLKIELEDIDFGEFDNFTMDDLGDLGINFDDDGGGEGETPDSSSGEVDVDSFDMECRCPKCGFEFDPKNKG